MGRPAFLHPQIPPNAVRDASYRGFDPTVELALATFGWGWHIEAGLADLRLILRGTFDRHPDLQIVLGHRGEMVLFALDRVDSLSHVATHLDRRVADYFRTNVHLATSGMLTPRLLRHALDFTSIDRILLSGDYPFHRCDAAALTDFLATLPDPADRHKIAHANAEALYGLESPPPGAACCRRWPDASQCNVDLNSSRQAPSASHRASGTHHAPGDDETRGGDACGPPSSGTALHRQACERMNYRTARGPDP